jgi:2-methylaconitate cis-trans-isomerase PrpF
MPQVAVPAAFYRGGTSRAIFFRADDLAGYDDQARLAIILAGIGSPDPYGRELDGLGGGVSSLSKVAIVGRAPAGVPADVTFTFGQVDVRHPVVEFNGTCGNISAAVAPFAIDEGLVPAVAPVTSVRVSDVNTGQVFLSRVEVAQDTAEAEAEGDFRIDGVAGPAAPVELEYQTAAGSLGQGVLPTGLARQELGLDGHDPVEVSIVDAVNPMVFARAADVGLSGTESPARIDADAGLRDVLGQIRARAAVLLGLAATPAEADESSRAIPKVVVVASPAGYQASSGRTLAAADVDLVTRMLSMGVAHQAMAGSAALCTAVAAAIAGTVVSEVTGPRADGTDRVRIGHPAGVLVVRAQVDRAAGGWVVRSASTFRTARRIMSGHIYVPSRYLAGKAWFHG